MSDFPQHAVAVHHVEPVPRRVRAFFAGAKVLDTTRALYVWEVKGYPAFYIPRADVDESLLVDEHHEHTLSLGSVRRFGLQAGDRSRAGAGRLYSASDVAAVIDHYRFEWDALDAWFEEDERIFVHPRSPYARVDALRSTRRVRIELGGALLAETASPVMVFETGLPTRYYVNRSEVDFARLEASDTTTVCPYKGRTSGYWSARVAGKLHSDVAWTYEFPTTALAPIAGLVAFYNEKVDIVLDGAALERPTAKPS